MKKVVISLGGSLIASHVTTSNFLTKLRKTIESHYKTHRFVIVCGGGEIARQYMSLLDKSHKTQKEISMMGIKTTCLNAEFMMEVFGQKSNKKNPKSLKEVQELLEKNHVVFCCAWKYLPNRTSDSTAADIAAYLRTEFINMSNVTGLYTKDPRKYKDAKLIKNISWKEFESIAHARTFKPGQHFIIDQHAATVIRKHKIPAYLIGKSMKQLSNILMEKPFNGTKIAG